MSLTVFILHIQFFFYSHTHIGVFITRIINSKRRLSSFLCWKLVQKIVLVIEALDLISDRRNLMNLDYVFAWQKVNCTVCRSAEIVNK